MHRRPKVAQPFLNAKITEIRRLCAVFYKKEKRAFYYPVVAMLIRKILETGDEKEVSLAQAVAVLLYAWNRAFYRATDSLSIWRLDRAIKKNRDDLRRLRNRSIRTFDEPRDKSTVVHLFKELMDATRNTRTGTKSPVAVAKTLHMLAPDFFPLWDRPIAAKWGSRWKSGGEDAAEKYLDFMVNSRDVMDTIKANKLTLKMLDEANYAKFTLPKNEAARRKRNKTKR